MFFSPSAGQGAYSSQANSPSTSCSGSPLSLKRSLSVESWTTSLAEPTFAAQGASHSLAGSSTPLRTRVTPLRPDRAQPLPKPFKCPKPGCSKSYKQANGLKYHIAHGRCSIATPQERELHQDERERETERQLKPYCCQVPPCQRRYKNINGRRYHYQHSGEHGAIGLKMLAEGRHDATKDHSSGWTEGEGS